MIKVLPVEEVPVTTLSVISVVASQNSHAYLLEPALANKTYYGMPVLLLEHAQTFRLLARSSTLIGSLI